MVMLDLAEEGNYFAVRPSGTEPKVKFYTFAAAPPTSLAEVAKARQKLQERLAALERDIRQYVANCPG
jgi:phosphoglucomutase/phosphomannomutase